MAASVCAALAACQIGGRPARTNPQTQIRAATAMLAMQAQPKVLSSSRRGVMAAARLPAVTAVAPPVAPRTTLLVEAKQPKGKMKTRKAIAKRYKITGSGKVICRHAGKQHLNEKMNSKRLSRLGKEQAVFTGDVYNNVRRALPYAKINLAKQREACKKK